MSGIFNLSGDLIYTILRWRRRFQALTKRSQPSAVRFFIQYAQPKHFHAMTGREAFTCIKPMEVGFIDWSSKR